MDPGEEAARLLKTAGGKLVHSPASPEAFRAIQGRALRKERRRRAGALVTGGLIAAIPIAFMIVAVTGSETPRPSALRASDQAVSTVAAFEIEGEPRALATVDDRSCAAALLGDGTAELTCIDPVTGERNTTPLPMIPSDMVAGAGSLYLVGILNDTSTAIRIDPTSGDVLALRQGVGSPIAYGGGRLWAIARQGDPALVSLEEDTLDPLAPIALPGSVQALVWSDDFIFATLRGHGVPARVLRYASESGDVSVSDDAAEVLP
jgi:hypothetical protein